MVNRIKRKEQQEETGLCGLSLRWLGVVEAGCLGSCNGGRVKKSTF